MWGSGDNTKKKVLYFYVIVEHSFNTLNCLTIGDWYAGNREGRNTAREGERERERESDRERMARQ